MCAGPSHPNHILADPTVALMQQALHTSAQARYDTAISYFDDLATTLESPLLRSNMMWRAGICHVCKGDMPSAANAIQAYGSSSGVDFANTQEYAFLQEVLDAVALNDVPRFVHACSEYDRTARLDSWAISLLLRIKTQMHASQDANGTALTN